MGRNPPKNLPQDAHIKAFKKFAKKNPVENARIRAQAMHQRLAMKRAIELELESLNIPIEDKILLEVRETEEHIGRTLEEDEVSAITSSIILAEKKIRGKYKKSLPQVKKEFSKMGESEKEKIVDGLANEILAELSQEIAQEIEESYQESLPLISSSSVSFQNPLARRSGIPISQSSSVLRSPSSVHIDSTSGTVIPSVSISTLHSLTEQQDID